MTTAEQGLAEQGLAFDRYTGKTTQKVLEQARGQSGSLSEGWLRIGWPVACELGSALIILIDVKDSKRKWTASFP